MADKKIFEYTKVRTRATMKDDDKLDSDSTEDAGINHESAQEDRRELQAYLDTRLNLTGTVISFDKRTAYGSSSTPETGNITDDFTDAVDGIIQKIYHNNGTAPTFPAGWVQLGDGAYFTGQLNVIYADYSGGTRVEYWIVQVN